MQIAEFQLLMKTLYFENDTQRGIHRTALWLTEEIGELMREIKKDPESIDLIKAGEEMADIYAWVASLANLLQIDLDKEIIRKYPQKCPKCASNPCKCRKFIAKK